MFSVCLSVGGSTGRVGFEGAEHLMSLDEDSAVVEEMLNDARVLVDNFASFQSSVESRNCECTACARILGQIADAKTNAEAKVRKVREDVLDSITWASDLQGTMAELTPTLGCGAAPRVDIRQKARALVLQDRKQKVAEVLDEIRKNLADLSHVIRIESTLGKHNHGSNAAPSRSPTQKLAEQDGQQQLLDRSQSSQRPGVVPEEFAATLAAAAAAAAALATMGAANAQQQHTLPGGMKEGMAVMSRINFDLQTSYCRDGRCVPRKVTRGDIGEVIGRATVQPGMRVRCKFPDEPSTNFLPTEVIALHPEQWLSPGDEVVSLINFSDSTVRMLRKGDRGTVLSIGNGQDRNQISCRFPDYPALFIRMSEIRRVRAVDGFQVGDPVRLQVQMYVVEQSGNRTTSFSGAIGCEGEVVGCTAPRDGKLFVKFGLHGVFEVSPSDVRKDQAPAVEAASASLAVEDAENEDAPESAKSALQAVGSVQFRDEVDLEGSRAFAGMMSSQGGVQMRNAKPGSDNLRAILTELWSMAGKEGECPAESKGFHTAWVPQADLPGLHQAWMRVYFGEVLPNEVEQPALYRIWKRGHDCGQDIIKFQERPVRLSFYRHAGEQLPDWEEVAIPTEIRSVPEQAEA
mmetsp:Transcript_46803/g.144901  ORF Transcript_46803/g.144901 Transcript_46803/m.144901 type:complete len:631 (-) Transcript_46803:112-2004(-)